METTAALLPAIELLSKPTAIATAKVIRFTSQLNALTSILTSIRPLLDDVDNLNRLLQRPYTETQGFTHLLSEGEQLVQCCSRIKKWDLINRWRYSNKLTKFETKLQNFYGHVLPVLQFRENIRIYARLCGLNEQLPDENPCGQAVDATEEEEDGLNLEISFLGEMPLLEELGNLEIDSFTTGWEIPFILNKVQGLQAQLGTCPLSSCVTTNHWEPPSFLLTLGSFLPTKVWVGMVDLLPFSLIETPIRVTGLLTCR